MMKINDSNLSILVCLCFVGALVVVMFGVLTPSTKNEMNVSAQYCEMWGIWHDSDGEYGWPDKNNSYDKWCK